MTVDRTDQTAWTGSRPVPVLLPGADSAVQQFGTHVVCDHELARQDAVEDQQPDMVAARAGQARDVPRADRQPVRADDELPLRLPCAACRSRARQARVRLQQTDRVGALGIRTGPVLTFNRLPGGSDSRRRSYVVAHQLA